jgi:hypothetical protein
MKINLIELCINMKNNISGSLIGVLREFGPVGLVTYVGGLILLGGFFRERELVRQITLGLVGLILLSLSIFISYFRLKIQKDREKALIAMEESTCNRLAEQLGKGLTDKQIFGIIQKIRQTQRDLITSIVC